MFKNIIIFVIKLQLVLTFPGCSEQSLLCSEDEQFINNVLQMTDPVSSDILFTEGQYVTSPLANVLVKALVKKDNELLQQMEKALERLEQDVKKEKIDVTQVSFGFTKQWTEEDSKMASSVNTEVLKYPSKEKTSINSAIEKKFYKATGRTEDELEASSQLMPERTALINPYFLKNPVEKILEQDTSKSSVYTSALALEMNWENPFHPRYSHVSKFSVNGTNAFKTRFMNNIANYKFKRDELNGFKFSSVFLPFNNTRKLMVFIVPNKPQDLKYLSEAFRETNVTSFMESFETRRVQLYIPQLQIQSQVVMNPSTETTMLSIGDLQVTYSGIRNDMSYKEHMEENIPPYERQTKRKTDTKFKVNKPFIFYIYDPQIGVLNYGEVIKPITIENSTPMLEDPIKSLPPQAKQLSKRINSFGLEMYELLRHQRPVDSNIATSPYSLMKLYSKMMMGSKENTLEEFLWKLRMPQFWKAGWKNLTELVNTPGMKHYMTFPENIDEKYIATLKDHFHEDVVISKHSRQIINGRYEVNYTVEVPAKHLGSRKFYKNEKNYVAAQFFEYSGPAQYVKINQWDAQVIKMPLTNPEDDLVIMVPSLRSGISKVEEGLQTYPLDKLLCRQSTRNMRIRLPYLNFTDEDLDISTGAEEEFQMGELLHGSGTFDMFREDEDKNTPVLLQCVEERVNLILHPSRESYERKFCKRGCSRQKGGKGRYKKFNVDRPFLFQVRRRETVLIQGRISNPSEGYDRHSYPDKTNPANDLLDSDIAKESRSLESFEEEEEGSISGSESNEE